MTRRYEDFREEDAFDENGLLRDGHKSRVPLTMRDAMTPLQREIGTRRARVTDGNGDSGEFAFSRPGFRIMNDAAARAAREAAHREYVDYITNAYKQPQLVRDQDTRAGESVSISHDEPPDRHRFDGMTVDQIARCHQQNMRRIYDQVERELSEAWRQR